MHHPPLHVRPGLQVSPPAHGSPTPSSLQTAHFPVVYYVDPRFGQNDDTRGIQQITLSYTFYPAQPLAAKPGQGYSTP